MLGSRDGMPTASASTMPSDVDTDTLRPTRGRHLDARPAAPAPIGYHLTLRLEDDRSIATTAAAHRVLARVVLEQGEKRGLLAFGAADNHLHAELATDRATAGDFAQYVAISLRWQLALAARFEPARVRPLIDQRHAYNTFFYVLRQEARHALKHDAAREATSLPDLLGLRVRPTTVAGRVRAHLPRVRREALVALLPSDPFNAASGAVPVAFLAEAACAAFALADLHARSPDACAARHAAVHAGGPRASTRELSQVLGLVDRAVRALRERPADPAVVRAVVLQARLLAAIHPMRNDLIVPPAQPAEASAPRPDARHASSTGARRASC